MHPNLLIHVKSSVLDVLPVSTAFVVKIPVLIHPVKQNIVLSRLNTLNIKLIAIPIKLEMTFCIRIVVISSDKFNICIQRCLTVIGSVIDHCYFQYPAC